MYDRVDDIAASEPNLADLVARLVEAGEPSALPFLLAPDLVKLIQDLDTPGEVARTILEFMQGLQVIVQIRYEDMEGLVA